MQQCVAMNNFRNNLRKAIEAAGMTQRDLADASGICYVNISRILGEKEGVTLERAERLANAVGIPLADMISAKFKILNKTA